MRFLFITLLAALSAVAAPTCGRSKVDSFTGVDSVNIFGAIGSFSGGGLGFMRLDAAGSGCEFAIPSGTGAPANVRGTTFLGKTIMDTAQINTLLAKDTSSYKPKLTADTTVTTYRANFVYATASTPARFDASKNLVSGSYTGTGTTEVLSVGPTVTSAAKFTDTVTIGTLSSAARGKLHVRSTTSAGLTPFFERAQPSAADAMWVTARFAATKDGTIGSGFGPVTQWLIMGADSVQRTIGQMGFTRTTNDSTGEFLVQTPLNGTMATRLQVSSSGTTVSGNFTATGAATLSSTLALTGNLTVNTNKVVVTASSGKIVSADTVVGVGFRATNYNTYGSTATFGGPLLTSSYLQSAFLRTSVGAGVRLTMSDSGGVLTPNTAGAAIRGAYNFSDTLNANRMIIGTSSTLQDANAAAVRVTTTAAGGGNVSGVSSRLSFTGATPSIAAAFRARVLNSDGDASIVAGIFIDTLQQGTGGSAIYSVYSPGTAPAYLAGGVSSLGAMSYPVLDTIGTDTLRLGAQHHFIFHGTGGALPVVLPTASTCRGREYVFSLTPGAGDQAIKIIAPIGSILAMQGSFSDVTLPFSYGVGGGNIWSGVTLVSNGSDWVVTSTAVRTNHN